MLHVAPSGSAGILSATNCTHPTDLTSFLSACPTRLLDFLLAVLAVAHGFRSSFRDYAAVRTHTPHAVMEAALAHTVRNKAEAAYARSDLFEKRRALMDEVPVWWTPEHCAKEVSRCRRHNRRVRRSTGARWWNWFARAARPGNCPYSRWWLRGLSVDPRRESFDECRSVIRRGWRRRGGAEAVNSWDR